MQTEIVLALLLIKGVGNITVANFINTKKIGIESNAEGVFTEWTSFIAGKTRIETLNLAEFKNKIDDAHRILLNNKILGIDAISIIDSDFPQSLKGIKDPPVILYYKGNRNLLLHEKCIAVIGTRKATSHGLKIAEKMGAILGENECCVVSGLALGCDAAAHQGCLSVNGKTIAILATPLDNIQPQSNNKLAEEILEKGGLLLSEYYPNQVLAKGFYVKRDRLQSGISKAVIVIETDVTGGTMHTVEFALGQKKILACYKHPSKYTHYKQVKGTAKLINEGKAKVIESKESILELIDEISRQRIQGNQDCCEDAAQLEMLF